MKQFARKMGFDPSYVSHVEHGRHRPTEMFARRADFVLGTGDVIMRRYEAYRTAANKPGARGPTPARSAQPSLPALELGGLTVLLEEAELSYDGGYYRCHVRRRLRFEGDEPIYRYPIEVDVDRFPDDATMSRRLYRTDPLTLDEIDFSATIQGPATGPEELAEASPQPVEWEICHDRDAYKKIVVKFESEGVRLPMYRQHETIIDWSYRVSNAKWGPWFQRDVRWPTKRLVVRLNFPADLEPSVWGTEESYSRHGPLRNPIDHATDADRSVHQWSINDPSLRARYRFEWRFARAADGAPYAPLLPSAAVA